MSRGRLTILHSPCLRWRALVLILAFAAEGARGQIDTLPRDLIEVGYDQPLSGRSPQSEYAFYYYNRPDFFGPDVGLRAVIAPAYVDAEAGFRHLLSPTTDVGLGISGGAFGDNFYDVAQGSYRENQSFYGSGGGADLSVYQRLNPGMRLSLNLMVRGGTRYSTYFDMPQTADSFKLPRPQGDAYSRIGLRLGGKQPLLFPALGMEVSAWFERQRHFDADAYGFTGDRSVSPATDLYWVYAGLNYEFKPIGHKLSFAFTAGGSTGADLFNAWRPGGELPLASEFPLMIPGYYYQELTAIRFAHVYTSYSIPLDPAQRWDLRLEGATAHLDYLPGYQQRPWETGAGAAIGYAPQGARYKVVLRFGYGFDAIRHGKLGAESLGLLFQYDLGAGKHRRPDSDR